MRELTMNEVQDVNGGDVLAISSAFGHLGRAFGFGYAIGTLLREMANAGNNSGDSPFQYGA